jgi:dihydrofolate reductase
MTSAPSCSLWCMSQIVRSQITMSLDGFMAGPDQSEENPMGRGAMALHEWFFRGEEGSVDAEIGATNLDGTGAVVMGRNMFGPVRGEWSSRAEEWRGWWGEEPPYHAPVYVLTHHAREPLVMEGGTTFHFVTDGFDAALALAREAAGPDLDVQVAGGASTVAQALRAGVLDELFVHIAPLVLGAGERFFDGAGTPGLEIVETIASPRATHVRYRVAR